jgi:phosphatidate phosphatase APP1
MEKKKYCIIWDIDNTIADTKDRVHFITNKPRDWDAFFAASVNDEPIEAVNLFYNAINLTVPSIYNFIVTGRPEKIRDITEEWLKNNEIFHDGLFMRQEGDFRSGAEVKKDVLDQFREDGFEVLFAVEDEKNICKMFRDNDVFVFQTNEGDY